ncbi:MAG: redox-sensing transcriptional repressor Rex, partial [Caldilineaceae bacterium]|nr:redox-sensing transcriptional repressor Rex [Caldilineaceae bacterium]
RGFRVAAIFDEDPQKIGAQVGALTVESTEVLAERIKELDAHIAVIAVPVQAAQRVADYLIECGITSILCYAPITLASPPHVRVEYIDPVIHFQHMTYYLG